MGSFIYIISIILSLYVGVLFFRKWNLKQVKLTKEEKKIKAAQLGLSSYVYLSYKQDYKFLPIGLPIWLLFLLIIWSFIPIINSLAIIGYIIYILIQKSIYELTIKEIFGKEFKILNFLNKKI